MEYNSFDTDQKSSFDSFELQLTQQSLAFLKEIAKWATFLSIVGFIGLGFMLLAGIFVMAAGSKISEAQAAMGQASPFPMAAIGFVYLIASVLYFFPIMYLYKFASNTKDALASNNTEKLTAAFSNLKSHYKFLGILTIISIAFVILAFIFGIVAGVAAASSM